MFRKACLRLAGIYLVAVMAFSVGVSVWIYQLSTHELKEGLSVTLGVKEQAILTGDAPVQAKQSLTDKLQEGRQRVIAQLIYFNGAVFLIAGPGSYWLARRMLKPIDEAMRAQNQFTADASHELRTPIAAIKAQLELALLEKNHAKPKIRALLKSELEEINQLAAIADNLLVLAHENPAPASPIRVERIIEQLCKRWEVQAQAKHISLIRRFESRQAMIRANKSDLERLITILLDNAIKYSPEKTTVTIRLQASEKSVQIQVSDQGYGIPAGDMPHIFDRFYRADKARSGTQAAGHGLGLAIAKKIVNEHRGTLHVSSIEGKGSVFTVQFQALRNSSSL